ncbi:uncharacterized protein BT62DRAFT_589886 [Guyanagaster necrorhizus]|uniref:C2H2-type domain-containing protein n=1 Tax=Guyanagaster necrorhizus TaxID=856835 RepID=A0A9P7W194_9AGAR|nr:uncharacterized protein BT62DRAFT_589886 [Guyanagaster necrorhizus MCA 3950]KAG7449531.1 hypothetical protein BT62DRAFT_589886 [Guyanagaster necrorhizus MCA 3950]
MIWEFYYPDDFDSTSTDTTASTPPSFCNSEGEGEGEDAQSRPRDKITFIDETACFLSDLSTYSHTDRRPRRSASLSRVSEPSVHDEDLPESESSPSSKGGASYEPHFPPVVIPLPKKCKRLEPRLIMSSASSDSFHKTIHQPTLPENERILIKTERQEISCRHTTSEFIYRREVPLRARGRNVPSTSFDDETLASSQTLPSIPFGIVAPKAQLSDSSRRYICTFEGCGKRFIRGQHLKRHVKGVHLRERRTNFIFTLSFDARPSHLRSTAYRCPYDGCKQTFTRKDNLKQHILVCYSRPRPGIKTEKI